MIFEETRSGSKNGLGLALPVVSSWSDKHLFSATLFSHSNGDVGFGYLPEI